MICDDPRLHRALEQLVQHLAQSASAAIAWLAPTPLLSRECAYKIADAIEKEDKASEDNRWTQSDSYAKAISMGGEQIKSVNITVESKGSTGDWPNWFVDVKAPRDTSCEVVKVSFVGPSAG